MCTIAGSGGMSNAKSFFKHRQKLLGIAATAYVVLLLLSHWQLPAVHVWIIAAAFSVLMNFTYLTEAISRRSFVKTELIVALTLIVASVLGVLVTPLLVIAAIFGHGVWDLHKHFGRGVPFFFWYTCSCFLVDTAYSISLLVYYFSQA